MLKTKLRVRYLLLILAISAPLLPTVVLAQAPGKHPAYLHALADLRWARGYLSQPSGNGAINNDAALAIQQVDKAIQELKTASIDDGKDVNAHPPIDRNVGNTDRLHKAIELLDQARADVNKEEDDPNAHGLQGRIITHIDTAHRYIDHAMSMGH